MNTFSRLAQLTPLSPAPMPGTPFLTSTLNTDVAPVSLPSRAGGRFQNGSSASAPRTTEAPLIFVVDDVVWLTLLYTLVLETAGYGVQSFNDRAEALAALKADGAKPDLLITDDLGHGMPVEQFMQQCREVHPALQILMASGFSRIGTRFSGSRPDRFIQKPFTPEELGQAVSAALTIKHPNQSIK